ncbi:MAG TPA: RagB/SusD family nutrient uptake outer membrane protein [Longimicrobium sp.]|nr:RagB/SusD family nutrient uptake outer membrane protein [Longimicrobium sp.]
MKYGFLGLVAATVLLAGCDDPLNPTPQQSIPQQEALDTPEEIRVATNAMYDAFQNCDGSYCRDLLIYPDLYSDNLRFTGTYTTDREVSTRSVKADNGGITDIWNEMFDAVNRANNIVAAAPEVVDLDADEAASLAAEARFVRALGYFNLVKFFGGVPLVTQPEWELSEASNVPRSTEAEIWAFIEAELTAAMADLPLAADGEQPAGRATREAAQALKARAHLYQREWQQAYDLSNDLIENGPFALEDDYAAVFNYQSEGTDEDILTIPFSVTDSNALAFWFFPSSLGGRRGIAPSNAGTTTQPLLTAFSAGDERRAVAFQGSGNSAYAFKYTDVATGTDNVPVIRLGEVYLIRAEAAARLNLLVQAVEDVNTIRNRAGVADLDASVDTQTEVLVAVLNERRLELFYEGHRFFDLKRFNDIPSVATYMASLGLTGPKLLFPIPQREIDANPALQQNPGY